MASTMKLIDENANAITAQQAYDAAMSGPVYAFCYNDPMNDTITVTYLSTLSLVNVFKESGNVVSVLFTGTVRGTSYYFYAGEDPNNLIPVS